MMNYFQYLKNEAAEDGDGTTPDLGPTLIDSIMSFDFVRIGKNISIFHLRKS